MTTTRSTARQRLWIALLAVLALAVAACNGDDTAAPDPGPDDTTPDDTTPDDGTPDDDTPAAPEPVTLEIVQSVDSLTFLPIYAALTQGYYDEAGLTLDITIGGVGGREIQALLAGEIDIAFSAGTELVKVAAQGRDIIAVQAMGNQSAFAATINPDSAERIGFDDSWSFQQRIDALDGMTVGITSPGALSDTIARYWIAEAGLTEADTSIVATGPPTGGVAALQQGDVDVLMSWSPFAEQIQAQDIGLLYLDARAGVDPGLSPWLEQTIVTTPQYAEANADVVSRLVQATTQGNEWIAESSVEEIADMVLTFEPFAGLDRDVVIEAVDAMKGSFTPDGRVTPEQLENIERVLTIGEVITEGIEPDEHFDNSYLEG